MEDLSRCLLAQTCFHSCFSKKTFYVSEAESSLMPARPLGRTISYQALEMTAWKMSTVPKLGNAGLHLGWSKSFLPGLKNLRILLGHDVE